MKNQIKAILDAYNPTGTTAHVNFTTSKELRWETRPDKVPCQLGGLRQRLGGRVRPRRRGPPARPVLRQEPRGWGSRCPTSPAPPRANTSPTSSFGSTTAALTPLNLIVEVKGYRGEDAKDKANTMRSYWVPGVNNLGKFGRWEFAEFTAVYQMEAEFDQPPRGARGRPGTTRGPDQMNNHRAWTTLKYWCERIDGKPPSTCKIERQAGGSRPANFRGGMNPRQHKIPTPRATSPIWQPTSNLPGPASPCAHLLPASMDIFT